MKVGGVTASAFYLVVGLGNPGADYVGTRHNFGFEVVSFFAEKHRFSSFKRERGLQGKVTSGCVGGAELLLLQPSTYMNESGVSVAAAMRYFKVPLSHLLIVVDDVAISLGEIRMRAQGSSGGHNGLKSIEMHLGTNVFSRLRVGVGRGEGEDLADYVLSPFHQEEKKALPEILERAVRSIEMWIEYGINRAVDDLMRQ